MTKLYLASNYVTRLYELDESGACMIVERLSVESRRAGNVPTTEFITVDEAIKRFDRDIGMFDILRAEVIERIDLENDTFKWETINRMI